MKKTSVVEPYVLQGIEFKLSAEFQQGMATWGLGGLHRRSLQLVVGSTSPDGKQGPGLRMSVKSGEQPNWMEGNRTDAMKKRGQDAATSPRQEGARSHL